MELKGFDPTQQDEFREGGILPEGKYLAVIVDSEEKVNRKGTGSYLELRFQVIDGD